MPERPYPSIWERMSAHVEADPTPGGPGDQEWVRRRASEWGGSVYVREVTEWRPL